MVFHILTRVLRGSRVPKLTFYPNSEYLRIVITLYPLGWGLFIKSGKMHFVISVQSSQYKAGYRMKLPFEKCTRGQKLRKTLLTKKIGISFHVYSLGNCRNLITRISDFV